MKLADRSEGVLHPRHHVFVRSLVQSDRIASLNVRAVQHIHRNGGADQGNGGADQAALTVDGATLPCSLRHELATHARIRRRT
jgi:hypothetical protein